MVGKLFFNNRSNQTCEVHIPTGKLAAQQWYERDPSLLAAEKAAMRLAFPKFQIYKLDDGNLCWIGDLCFDEFGYNIIVKAVYRSNHPNHLQGCCSIKIYVDNTYVHKIMDYFGKLPLPFHYDTDNSYFINTHSKVELNEDEVFSVASVMHRVVMILSMVEICMTGELTVDEYEEGLRRFDY